MTWESKLKTLNMESQYKIFESNLWPVTSSLLFPSVRKQILNVKPYINLQLLHCSKICTLTTMPCFIGIQIIQTTII